FVEQSRILNGNNCLFGEIRDKFNLLVGERANFLAEDANRSDDFTRCEHRNNQLSPKTGSLYAYEMIVNGIVRFGHNVCNVNNLLSCKRPGKSASRWWSMQRVAPTRFRIRRRHVV